jgi:hypothetical protein
VSCLLLEKTLKHPARRIVSSSYEDYALPVLNGSFAAARREYLADVKFTGIEYSRQGEKQ